MIEVGSVKEVIDYAKVRPGKLNYSAAGAGSNTRLAFEYFMQKAGLDIVMVAYKGGAGGAALGVAVMGSLAASKYAVAVNALTTGLPDSAQEVARSSLAGALHVASELPPDAAQPLTNGAVSAFIDDRLSPID